METFRQIPTRFISVIQSQSHSERGAALLEYAMLVALIAMVAIISVTAFGDALGDKNSGIAGSINCATSNPGC
jgi:Flp pilus assembly pilin Flp